MRSFNLSAALIIGCLVLALAVLAPPSTRGDEWNLATKFEINHASEVPGLVLQPNTRYTIKLLDSPSERNVVQIYNEDQTQMLTMFMAISDERVEPTDRTQFTFIETQPEYPLPIKEWFYPGHLRGLEFVYPKDQAIKISEHALEPVLSGDTNDLHDLASIKVEAIGPIGTPLPATESAANVTNKSTVTEEQSTTTESTTPAVAENTPAPAVQEQEVEQHNEEHTQIAQNTEPAPLAAPEPQVTQPAPQPQAPASTEESRELPRTAGELPLIALIGALCLGAGLGLKVLSARS
jgi:hypothetical protein